MERTPSSSVCIHRHNAISGTSQLPIKLFLLPVKYSGRVSVGYYKRTMTQYYSTRLFIEWIFAQHMCVVSDLVICVIDNVNQSRGELPDIIRYVTDVWRCIRGCHLWTTRNVTHYTIISKVTLIPILCVHT